MKDEDSYFGNDDTLVKHLFMQLFPCGLDGMAVRTPGGIEVYEDEVTGSYEVHKR